MKPVCLLFFILLFLACQPKSFNAKWLNDTAPEKFSVRFETTKGNIDIAVERSWSPKAVDRFYQQVKHHYYDNAVFYRVIPGFVAQFGNSNPKTEDYWGRYKLPDEKVLLSNKKGTISFARGGKETRNATLFINTGNNMRLDTIHYSDVTGFPAFGNVVEGIDVVTSIYSDYKDKPTEKLSLLYNNRNQFLDSFPQLDLIKKIYFIKSN